MHLKKKPNKNNKKKTLANYTRTEDKKNPTN